MGTREGNPGFRTGAHSGTRRHSGKAVTDHQNKGLQQRPKRAACGSYSRRRRLSAVLFLQGLVPAAAVESHVSVTLIIPGETQYGMG